MSNEKAPQPHWRATLPKVSARIATKGGKSNRARHTIYVIAESSANRIKDLPHCDALATLLQRKRLILSDLTGSSICGDLPNGEMAAWVVLPAGWPMFRLLTALRKAVAPLLTELPDSIRFEIIAAADERVILERATLRVLLINGINVDTRPTDAAPLQRIETDVDLSPELVAREAALAEGNALTRWLTALPPNILTPKTFRLFCEAEAKRQGWICRVYSLAELKRMGAGCFVAVASGSDDPNACIVHLQRTLPHAKRKSLRVSLVGKGVCFDTGGYNIKSYDEMQYMHEDMNGAAVAIGLMATATKLNIPLHLDCWLAIAENRIGPNGYVPQSVVTALDGTTVEIVHTDCEGRLLLADAISLARNKSEPDIIIDFATLTESMIQALGNRMTGVFSSDSILAAHCIEASTASGERATLFPLEDDYDEDLESELADLAHTNLEVEGSAIFAARFLLHFAGDVPLVHADLSAWRHDGGLGAVGTDITGWGVYWGEEMLARLAQQARHD